MVPTTMPHLANLGRWYPCDIISRMRTAQTMPTVLFDRVFRSLDPQGDMIDFLGRVKTFNRVGRNQPLLSIDPLLLPFFEQYYSHLVIDGVLKSDYRMATPYALGEYTSLSKYAKHGPYFHSLSMHRATIMLSNVCNCMRGSDLLDPVDAASFIVKNTSPGYPWQLRFDTKGALLLSCEYWDYYRVYRWDIMRGVFRPNFWKGFVKREPKKIGKLLAHLPRTILSGATEHLHQGYELFMDQNEKIKAESILGRTPFFVGCTKYMGGWQKLFFRIDRFPNHFDGDCDQWDASMFRAMFNIIKYIRFSNFRDRNQALWNMLTNYYANVVGSAIVGSLGDLFF